MILGKWNINKYDEFDSLRKIAIFLLNEFCRIFGTTITNGGDCSIINDPKGKNPWHIHDVDNSLIILAQEDTTYWAQTIYQLSHELCHYALRQNKSDKESVTSWFEELVCEAVSLYALNYSANYWNKCDLFLVDPNFDKAISNYLKSQLSRKGTGKFAYAIEHNLLEEYNKIAQDDRESRIDERDALYKIILDKPEDLKVLCNYQMHTSDNIHIDFSGWYDEHPCAILEFFENLMFRKDDNFNVSD